MKSFYFFLSIILSSWLSCQTVGETSGSVPHQELTLAAQKRLSRRAEQVLMALKDQRFDTLAEVTHPARGLCFSPSAHVRGSSPVFESEGLRQLPQTEHPIFWGNEALSGDSLNLTFKQYYSRYLYDRDYLAADSIFFNYHHQRGNVVNNLRSAFGNHAVVIEYFVPGNSDYSQLDWRSLRLVFAPHADEWFLVGVVHSQWMM